MEEERECLMMSTVEMVTQISPLAAADVRGLPYSPALLLDSKLDASITDHPQFGEGCGCGFRSYFGFQVWDESRDEWVEAEVNTLYPWDVVVRFLTGNVLDEEGGRHPWRIGYVLGWLSAFALADCAMCWRRWWFRLSRCLVGRW
jgi:hypothetical protein